MKIRLWVIGLALIMGWPVAASAGVKLGKREVLKKRDGWHQSRREIRGRTRSKVFAPDVKFVEANLAARVGAIFGPGSHVRIVLRKSKRKKPPIVSQTKRAEFGVKFDVKNVGGRVIGKGSAPVKSSAYTHGGKAYIETDVGKGKLKVLGKFGITVEID